MIVVRYFYKSSGREIFNPDRKSVERLMRGEKQGHFYAETKAGTTIPLSIEDVEARSDEKS